MTAAGILAGIDIVEVAEGIAGSVPGMLLAAAGAAVTKIEPPGGAADRGTPGFASWNRGKASLVLDLDDAADRDRLYERLASADVLIYSLTPARALRLGLDDKSLKKLNPALVVCGITGYPAGHRFEEFPVSDLLVLASAGLLDEQAAVTRPGPAYLRFPLASWGACYLAASGVLARLIQRESTGCGGPIHTSLYQGALVPMTMHWARAESPSPSFAAGMPKDISQLPMMTPSIFQCADGKWFHVMASPDRTPLMQQVFAEMGEEGLAKANAEFGLSEPHRNFPNWGANVVAFSQYDRQRWLEEMWAHDVPVQPTMQMGEGFFDEQAIANGYVVDVEDPTFGSVRQAGTPFDDGSGSVTILPTPTLDSTPATTSGRPAEPPSLTPHSDPLSVPLAGLKVLDFGMFLAGPIAPMFLGDLGAEVIKVEAPSGDQMRFVERTFAGCQRSKRDIAVDLKNPRARPILEALVKWADVVHHNIRLPAARKLGIDEESLREINPDLIFCHVSSYGAKGERADWPGFDQLFQAFSGWEYEGAGEGNQPMWHRFGMMDHQAGMASLVATLLGLYGQIREGAASSVSASILGASLLTMSETMVMSDGTLAPYEKLDHEQMGVAETKRIVELADGWLAIDAPGPAEIRRLCAATGSTTPSEAMQVLSGWALEDALTTLNDAGVPVSQVALNQMDTFFEDADNERLGLIARYPHPQYGAVEQVGAMWSLGDTALSLKRSSPILGQHTIELLAELGFDSDSIGRFIDDGVVVDASNGNA